mmetsp:Transcript_13591/g.27075  ORF Transcript_13591/g.27075 Transcript_13591/m.27075 type:complete len:177 (-) Transcript_13591:218-748(-)
MAIISTFLTALILLLCTNRSITSAGFQPPRALLREPTRSYRATPKFHSDSRSALLSANPGGPEEDERPPIGPVDTRPEISLDGSLLVTIPAIVIAVLGIITTVLVADGSRQASVEVVEFVDKNADYSGGKCRGICSNDGQSEALESFMRGISSGKRDGGAVTSGAADSGGRANDAD